MWTRTAPARRSEGGTAEAPGFRRPLQQGERVGRAGLTAEIHATTDYELTRAWANSIAATGLKGIRYRARHDPATKLTALALFSRRGPLDAEVIATEPLPLELVRDAERQFGLVAAPRRLRRR